MSAIDHSVHECADFPTGFQPWTQILYSNPKPNEVLNLNLNVIL
jgi:hypothetical protein